MKRLQVLFFAFIFFDKGLDIFLPISAGHILFFGFFKDNSLLENCIELSRMFRLQIVKEKSVTMRSGFFVRAQ